MSTKQIYKQIKLLHIAIAIGLGAFAIISIYYTLIHGKAMELDYSTNTNLKSLLIILALAGIPASFMFQKRSLKHIDKNASPIQKLTRYRSIFFIKIVTFEGLALVSLLGYLATAQFSYISIFGILYVAFLINYPRKQTLIEELTLDESDFNN